MRNTGTGPSRQLVRFGIVGVAAALLLFGLTWSFTLLGLPVFAAGLGAYLLAFAVAYSLQQSWTFEGRSDHRVALPRYLAVQIGCALLAGGSAQLAALVLGSHAVLVAAFATVVSSAASFVLSSRWAFPDGRAS